jgi:hypothetical protein
MKDHVLKRAEGTAELSSIAGSFAFMTSGHDAFYEYDCRSLNRSFDGTKRFRVSRH